MYRRSFKQLFDFISAIILFVLSLPIFIGVSAGLFFQNKGRIFFYQLRPGLNEKPFHIIKFKTMTDESDNEGNLLPDIKRLTKFGSMIRKLSIDELPQLINVIKGDMSLVGPRPLLFKYIPLYSDTQKKRHLVKPGITGWAQVNGRNSISWTKKFEFDIDYVDKQSFAFDLKIIWLTVLKVIRREGIDNSKDRPMYPFDGKN
jgi:undecaprenyl phosphate N,N'-diacetylbacillosamine 1-phosphate transferase